MIENLSLINAEFEEQIHSVKQDDRCDSSLSNNIHTKTLKIREGAGLLRSGNGIKKSGEHFIINKIIINP